MSLFKKKTADEMQDKIIETIQKYKDSFSKREVLEEKIKENKLKATIGFIGGATAGVGGFLSVAAASAGIIAAPVAMTALTIGTGVGWIGLAYAGVHYLVKQHQEKEYYKADSHRAMYKAEQSFENKINKILSKTDHGELSHDEMFKLKSAVINDNGTSLDNALKEMNLPDTKHKKVFKENIAGQLEASVERILPKSFYSTRKESLKTGLGLTVAMGGAVAAVGGMTAASLMATGLGTIALVGATAWSGIRLAAEAIENRQIKKHFEKNDEIGNRKTKLAI